MENLAFRLAQALTLAGRLKLAREVRGLTQQQLSDATGVKQSDISKLERGQIEKTTSLPALARTLLCNIDWLDSGEGDPDFGLVSKGWPFPDRELLTQVRQLSHDQRLELQGVIRKQVGDFHSPTPPPLPAFTLRRKPPPSAKKTRASGAK